MTDLLSKAFQKVSKLPENLQDEVATQLLEDMEGEFKWDETLAKSQNELEKMSDKALKEFREKRTKAMGFDEL